MIIRCERCSTAYELDEALLAPEGSSVQCTRCQHVFVARPPDAPGGTLVGLPAEAAPAEPAPPLEAVGAEPPPRPPAAAGGRVPVPARGAPAPVYRPTPGPTSVAAAPRTAPVLRKDAVGTYESRLRWNARIRWLFPVAVAALLAAAGAAWFLLSGGAPGQRTPAALPAQQRAGEGNGARRPVRQEPVPASAREAPVPAPASASIPGDAAPPARNDAALPASSPVPAPAPGDAPVAAELPTVALPSALPAPAAQPAPRRRAGVLTPAAIPEPAAASALPVVEPPEAVQAALEHSPVESRPAPSPTAPLQPSDGG